ncbi:MAG: polyprenyl synthetase family protein [Candidatus Promineifilaceae bacterium]|jgi:geranylgeranyl diphosphate synthase type I
MNKELSAMAQLMLPELDKEMQDVLQFTGSTSGPFLGMMHYQMGWVDESLHPIDPIRGKQIRPLIAMITNDAAGGNWRQVVPAAAGIEILHNFSLVHDDIEDVSPTRRGRPTIWKLWGEAMAINCGDAMFTLAHEGVGRLLETGTPPAVVVHALKRFDDTCFQLTSGQYADMEFETRDNVSVEEYLAMIKGKTGVLLAYSAEVGALVAGAEQDIVQHYAQLGLNLGLAFQVIDDILGIWGNESKTGKSAATDIITKKKTLPVLFGLENCKPLRDLYRDQTPDDKFVTQAVQLLEESGAREFAEEQAKIYSNAALNYLEAASPDGASGKAIRQLTNMLLMRDA